MGREKYQVLMVFCLRPRPSVLHFLLHIRTQVIFLLFHFKTGKKWYIIDGAKLGYEAYSPISRPEIGIKLGPNFVKMPLKNYKFRSIQSPN